MDDYKKRFQDFLKTKGIPVRAGQVPISRAKDVVRFAKEFQDQEDKRVFKESPDEGPHGFKKAKGPFSVDEYFKEWEDPNGIDHHGIINYETASGFGLSTQLMMTCSMVRRTR